VLRSDRHLDPAIQDELDALDAALRGEDPVAGDGERAGVGGTLREPGAGGGEAPRHDGALATLVADVRAARPELDAGARARLDERAAETRTTRRGAAVAGRARRRRLGLALAAVAAVAVPVGGLATTGWLGGDDSGETMAVKSSAELDPQSAPGADASAPAPASGARTPAPGGPPDLAAQRRVIRDVRQTVRVAPDGVARAAGRVSTVAEDAGGYLASSSVRERGPRAGGSFDVVVPVGRLDETVAALGRIGRPVRLSRSSVDVTEQAASLQDRLDDERADRAALRLQLARTVDPDRRAARRRELRLRSSRVARLEAQRDELRGRTATARIALRLTTREESAAVPPPKVDDGRWGLDDAWGDAGRVVEVGAGVALVGAVVLLPVALLLAGAVVLRRRAAAAGRDRLIGGA
jgi:hypothetical protein